MIDSNFDFQFLNFFLIPTLWWVCQEIIIKSFFPMNVLLVGDLGTIKSQLFQYVQKIAP